jgi:hypothetical protein
MGGWGGMYRPWGYGMGYGYPGKLIKSSAYVTFSQKYKNLLN